MRKMARWAQKAWTQLKLDGSWVKAGQDLVLQQTPRKPPTELVREPECSLPGPPEVGGCFAQARTVSSWCLGAARQRPPRALETDSPLRECDLPHGGPKVSQCPASIDYGGGEGGNWQTPYTFKNGIYI